MAEFDWTDEAIKKLTTLWEEGHSTAEIGRRMSCSKDAVVSKAHRLDLPGRPSPIKKDLTHKPKKPRVIGSGSTLQFLASTQITHPTVEKDPVISPVNTTTFIISPLSYMSGGEVTNEGTDAKPGAVQHSFTNPLQISPARTCQWPIGEPKSKTFRLCADAVVDRTTPYCPEHTVVAYVKVRDRRNDAA